MKCLVYADYIKLHYSSILQESRICHDSKVIKTTQVQLEKGWQTNEQSVKKWTKHRVTRLLGFSSLLSYIKATHTHTYIQLNILDSTLRYAFILLICLFSNLYTQYTIIITKTIIMLMKMMMMIIIIMN